MDSIRLSSADVEAAETASALRKNSTVRRSWSALTITRMVTTVLVALPLLCMGCSHSETSENTVSAPIDVPKAQAMQSQQIQKIQNSDMPAQAKAQAIAAIQANGKGQY